MSLKSFKIWLSSYERCVLELEKALHNIRQFASEYDDVIKAEHEGSKDMLDEYVKRLWPFIWRLIGSQICSEGPSCEK